ncbi:cupredoxin domain-containing protein [Thalassotalea sp. G2M2-11]|uniref:cupredoxin domain-containing protein n=1 Tax=Thalassotalea sp. G2M2-11 TaxID=2787627 RepID=UPI0019D0099F|nr:cupredoxin domain-containing protein [Thalassotalea sp. G2M2-11]
MVLPFDALATNIPEFHLTLENHLFFPAEIEVPANKKVKLIIYNKDDVAEEFDSFDLNREKMIFPKRKSTIYIGPLPPGEYHFFGEYNPNMATGKVVVKGGSNVN